MIPEAGHALNFQQPDAVVSALERFFAEQS